MKFLFLGDVVGRTGRDAIAQRLPGIIGEYGFDFVVINGENASHGRGLTETHYNELRAAGEPSSCRNPQPMTAPFGLSAHGAGLRPVCAA